MNKTKIEYIDMTWNPIAMRCTPVSSGCDNCWHLRMANRLGSVFDHFSGLPHDNWYNDSERAIAYKGGAPWLNTKELSAPLRRRKPTRIGVQLMGDLFHESISFEWIDKVYASMAASPQHQFFTLTKRPDRRFEWFERIHELGLGPYGDGNKRGKKYISQVEYDWPLPNVLEGVSVEDQKTADERIPILLKTPAAKRWVSYEPALEKVDFTRLPFGKFGNRILNCFTSGTGSETPWNVNLIVSGAETGPGARTAELDWFRSVRDQCSSAGVPFFFKRDSSGSWLLDGRMHEELP